MILQPSVFTNTAAVFEKSIRFQKDLQGALSGRLPGGVSGVGADNKKQPSVLVRFL